MKTWLLLFLVWAGAGLLPVEAVTERRWFRGVESVDRAEAGINDALIIRVRDLDGWLFGEMERKHILGEKHFQENQFELFLNLWQRARSQNKFYGDLMRDEQDRLSDEYDRLALARRKLDLRKLEPAPAAADGTTATPAATAAKLAADEKEWKTAHTKAEADQDIWFSEWQAYEAYQALLHEVKENLYLELNGSRLTHVKAQNPFESGKDVDGGVTQHSLEFVLKQYPADKAEWDKLYDGVHRFSAASVTVGFDMDGRSFVLDSEVQPATTASSSPVAAGSDDIHRRFSLITYSMPTMVAGLSAAGLALFAFFYLASRTELIREADAPKRLDGLLPFSLVQCQMSFWFFLFTTAYIFLWVIKRQTDTLTDQCLVLLGISTGTTLGAAFLSGRHDAPPQKHAARESGTTALEHHPIQQFFEDILSEERQISFQRFQVVVWTLVLGLVFIKSVVAALQMPMFGTNELTLMGISAGTYLGSKIPAAVKKPTTHDTPTATGKRTKAGHPKAGE